VPTNQRKEEAIVMAKQFEKVSFQVFDNACHELGIAEVNMCRAIGYSPNAYSHWRSEGLMPKVASMAVECMLRRQQKESNSSDTIVVKVSHSKFEGLKAVLDAFDCDFTQI
jgi:hypothetical protein